jgi:hypothetical protein
MKVHGQSMEIAQMRWLSGKFVFENGEALYTLRVSLFSELRIKSLFLFHYFDLLYINL